VRRPRLRSADGSSEVPLATYEWARDTELLERETMARMLAKLSCRRYGVGLGGWCESVDSPGEHIRRAAPANVPG
jgi:hypothetical protein